jgi:hypothetical protein
VHLLTLADYYTGYVFAPLADESYFALATILDGVVVWPNGVDIAPDAMYAEVSGNGAEASRFFNTGCRSSSDDVRHDFAGSARLARIFLLLLARHAPIIGTTLTYSFDIMSI